LLSVLMGMSAVAACLAFQSPVFTPSMGLRRASSAMGPQSVRKGIRFGGISAPKMVFGLDGGSTETAKFDPSGMTVKKFFEMSTGEWKCLRSSHNIAFGMVEETNTDMVIEDIPMDDPIVLEMCKNNDCEVSDCIIASKVSWEGYSDWDDKEINGTSSFAVFQDTETTGRLYRSEGYAESIPAASTWEITNRGEFILQTDYEALSAEETFWFKTPDLRVRCSSIKTQGGKGVTTCSLSTEVRTK